MDRDLVAEVADNPDMLFLSEEQYDKALVGYVQNEEGNHVALYDVNKLIDVMVEDFEMEVIDAWDHFGYNIESTYMGEHSPKYFYSVREEDF